MGFAPSGKFSFDFFIRSTQSFHHGSACDLHFALYKGVMFALCALLLDKRAHEFADNLRGRTMARLGFSHKLSPQFWFKLHREHGSFHSDAPNGTDVVYTSEHGTWSIQPVRGCYGRWRIDNLNDLPGTCVIQQHVLASGALENDIFSIIADAARYPAVVA
jgi:hypothetical protein